MNNNLANASLTIVGSGIKFLSHLTHEAKIYIQQSDKVLYLVNDPIMKQWIQKNNANTESLEQLYIKYVIRFECYQEITKYILKTLRQKINLCVVFYGHPSVFCQPGLGAVLQARQEGYTATILPGISAEACLFADLVIDPGSSGCQSFETTDFLIHQRKFDSNSHLILWQIDVIGALDNPREYNNSKGIHLLVEHLLKFYKPEHQVIIYEAAQYPSFDPVIEKIFLKNLENANFSRISTLYIPPANIAISNKAILEKLNLTNFKYI